MSRLDTDQFVSWSRQAIDELDVSRAKDTDPEPGAPTTTTQRSVLQAMETAIHHAESPLQRMEHSLELPVAFVIMPIFALANACLLYTSDAADERSSVDLGGRRIIKKKNPLCMHKH